MFTGIQKLKEFITSRSLLQEILNEIFQPKGKLYQMKISQRNKEHQKWQLHGKYF